jgi:hypothetical protein
MTKDILHACEYLEHVDPQQPTFVHEAKVLAISRPILTYNSKGCAKPGCKASKHGIVYEFGHSPHMVKGEPELGFDPVPAVLTEDGERLSRESRINYSKLVTIEHNVRVLFIGYIEPRYWPTVHDAVNACWDLKDHRHR